MQLTPEEEYLAYCRITGVVELGCTGWCFGRIRASSGETLLFGRDGVVEHGRTWRPEPGVAVHFARLLTTRGLMAFQVRPLGTRVTDYGDSRRRQESGVV